jgi:excisionase family DNA binding protein
MQEMQRGSANGSLLLTATQVRSRLGVDRSTVYRMALDGRLSAVKVGRQWRFPAARIDGLLATIESPLRMDRTPAPMGGFAVPRSTVVTLITVTAELLGVMMFVTDMDGHPLTEVTNPCPWFVDRAADPTTYTSVRSSGSARSVSSAPEVTSVLVTRWSAWFSRVAFPRSRIQPTAFTPSTPNSACECSKHFPG